MALHIPFIAFKKQIKGYVINVRNDVTSTIDILPRYVNDNGVVTVRLKKKIQYKSVYRKCNITPVKVLQALEWLMEMAYGKQSILSTVKHYRLNK